MTPSSSVETRLADVPAVMATPEGDDPAPVVLCWHGFGPPASAEALSGQLPLEGLEAWKVYLDLPLFGRRLPWDGPREVGRRQADDYLLELLWPVVEEAAGELPDVVAALGERLGELWNGRTGLVGYSAGGTAALYVLAERAVRVEAAVVVAASPGAREAVDAFERQTGMPYEWSSEARRVADRLDMGKRAGEIAGGELPPALRLVYGEEDPVAPSAYGRALHRALAEAYRARGASERLGLEVRRGGGHELDGGGGIAGWLDRWLAPPGSV